MSTAPAAEPSFVEESFASAPQFLEALRLSNERWPDPTLWAFRGQADSRWRLVPSLFRSDPLAFLYPTSAAVYRMIQPEGPAVEVTLLMEFLHAADRHGLSLPEDTQHLRGLDGFDREDKTFKVWPPAYALSVLALAQHHGIPTRLLDWSWKPFVAAYFATQDSQNDADTLAVWAVRTTFIQTWWRVQTDEGEPSGVRRLEVVTAPQASNPNLAAQAGVFTLHRGMLDASYDLKEVIVSNAALFGPGGLDLPVLRKLCLPRSEAKSLLRLLALEGTSAASVFPGYDGVVRSMRERHQWHPIAEKLSQLKKRDESTG